MYTKQWDTNLRLLGKLLPVLFFCIALVMGTMNTWAQVCPFTEGAGHASGNGPSGVNKPIMDGFRDNLYGSNGDVYLRVQVTGSSINTKTLAADYWVYLSRAQDEPDGQAYVYIYTQQRLQVNDLTYGTCTAPDWASKGHKFGDLVGSDKLGVLAGFRTTNVPVGGQGCPGGCVLTTGLYLDSTVANFYMDNVSASTLTSVFKSGYASLGPFGGDGKVIFPALSIFSTTIMHNTNANATAARDYATSLQYDLNTVWSLSTVNPSVMTFAEKTSLFTKSPTCVSDESAGPSASSTANALWIYYDAWEYRIPLAQFPALAQANLINNARSGGFGLIPPVCDQQVSPIGIAVLPYDVHNSPQNPGGATLNVSADCLTPDCNGTIGQSTCV